MRESGIKMFDVKMLQVSFESLRNNLIAILRDYFFDKAPSVKQIEKESYDGAG